MWGTNFSHHSSDPANKSVFFKRPRVFSSPRWPLVAPSCTSVRIPALRLLGTTICEQIISPSAEMYFRRRMRTSRFLSCSSRRHSMLFPLISSGDRDWLDSKAVITGANAGSSLRHLQSSSMSAHTNDGCEDPPLRAATSNSLLWGGVERPSSNIRPHWRHGNKALPQEVWSEVIGEDHDCVKFFPGLPKTTTARSSFLVTQYWRSALLSIWLPYATTCSHPPLSS